MNLLLTYLALTVLAGNVSAQSPSSTMVAATFGS
jgi:hypothetical protein